MTTISEQAPPVKELQLTTAVTAVTEPPKTTTTTLTSEINTSTSQSASSVQIKENISSSNVSLDSKSSNLTQSSSQLFLNANPPNESQNEEQVQNHCIIIIQSFIRQYLAMILFNELSKTKQFVASLPPVKTPPLTHVQRIKRTGRRPPTRGHRTPGALATPSTEYNGPIICRDPDDPEGIPLISETPSPQLPKKSRPLSSYGLVVFDTKDVKLRSVPVETQTTKKVEEEPKPEFMQIKLRKSLPSNMSSLIQSKLQDQQQQSPTSPPSQSELTPSSPMSSPIVSPTSQRTTTANTTTTVAASPTLPKHKKGPLDHIKQKSRSHSIGPVSSIQISEHPTTPPAHTTTNSSHSSPTTPSQSPFIEKKRSQHSNKPMTVTKSHSLPFAPTEKIPIPPPLAVDETSPPPLLSPNLNEIPLPPPLVLSESELPPPLPSPTIGEHEKLPEKKRNKIIQFLQKFFKHRVKRETLVQRGVIVETNVEYNETNTNVPSTISSRSTTANISQDSVCFNCKAELKKKDDKERHVCSVCSNTFCSKCMKKKSKKGKLCKTCAGQKEKD